MKEYLREVLLHRISDYVWRENTIEINDEWLADHANWQWFEENRDKLKKMLIDRVDQKREFLRVDRLLPVPVPEWMKRFTSYAKEEKGGRSQLIYGGFPNILTNQKPFYECLMEIQTEIKYGRNPVEARWVLSSLTGPNASVGGIEWLHLVNCGFVRDADGLVLNWRNILSRYRLTIYDVLKGYAPRYFQPSVDCEEVVDELNAIYPPYLQRKQAFIDKKIPHPIRDEILHHLMPFYHGPLGQ